MDIKPSNVLTFGILALAFSLSFYLSFLGIVFGAIGKNKAKAFIEANGETSGQVKAGNIMAKIGFIVGIVMTVFLVIAVIGLIAGN